MPKIQRDAFLYLDPEPGVDDFAQCSSCRDWVEGDDRCVIHGPMVTVKDTMSCGLYVYGETQDPGTETYFYISPRESGLVDRKVRCENCKWGGETCGFYDMLNKALPDVFDLDVEIEPKGCCNANEPRQ